MAKEPLAGKKRPFQPGRPKARKNRRSPARERDETALPMPGGPALGNRALQRLLPGLRPSQALAARLLRQGDLTALSPAALLTPQVLRQVAEAAQAEQAARRPRAVQGAVTIRPVQVEYYDVTGSSLAEVAGQLDPDEWGHCQASYNYTYAATGGRTTRINVTLTLSMRLPRWRGKGWQQASPQARREWNRMLQALRRHEDGHADIARKWAPIFQERLIDHDEADVAQEGAAVEAESQAEQDQFDVDTAHGQNSGVSLDLSIP